MDNSQRLNNLADLLEKTAVYLDTLEVKEVAEKEAAHHERVVAPVLTKAASALGEDLAQSVTEKLAKADPEILDLMQKISARREEERSSSLGGPSEQVSTKLAADSRDALLDFCLN